MGWTEADLTAEVLEAPRRAFAPWAEISVIERPGVLQLVTPALRQGGLNQVAHFDVDAARAEEEIDAALARFAAHGVRFRWPVDPTSRPGDLAERLARRGLRSAWVRGMWREVAPWSSSAGPEELCVEEVGPATVDEFNSTTAQGWGMSAEPLEGYHRAVLAAAGAHRMYLARWNGRPAGTAGLVAFARSVYLIGAVVLPSFRERGVYRALVNERLRFAAARGLRLATSHALEASSAPLLERLGFRSFCRFPSFSGP